MTANTQTITMKNRRDRDFLRICRRIVSESTRPLTAAQIAKAAAE